MAARSSAAPIPWLFLNATSEVGTLIYSVRGNDGRNLVPFASLELGDGDVACFDGGDTSGNPAVLMLVLDESGRKYSFSDFDEWLSIAEKEAKTYTYEAKR